MPHVNTLVNRDGWLYVAHRSADWDVPRITTVYWPVGLRTHDFKYGWGRDVPVEVRDIRQNGLYEIVEGSPLKVRLENGGQTKAAFIEHEPVELPKRYARKETRWHQGSWQFYSERKGWQICLA